MAPQSAWVSVPGFDGHNFRMRLNTAGAEFKEMARGVYDRDALAFLVKGARNAVAWDVGAHVGYASLMLASAFEVREVHAFEPHPGNVVRIQEHVHENASPIGVHQMALSDLNKVGELQFFEQVDAPQSTGGYLTGSTPPLALACYAGFTSTRCTLRTGDSLTAPAEPSEDDLTRAGLPVPDVVKIDVEGAELAVLRGMGRVLSRRMPRILLETHSSELRTDCEAVLFHLGYQVQTLCDLGGGRAHLLASVS